MLADDQWQLWLRDLSNSQRCVLVELTHGMSGTLRLATMPFQTAPDDVPADMPYDDIITELPELARADGNAFSLGDLELHVEAVDATTLIQEIWKQAYIYLGDVNWKKVDFRLMATCKIERVMRVATNRIRVEFSDDHGDLGRLVAVANASLPCVAGWAYNVKPVQTDALLMEYAVDTHSGQTLMVVNVKDNGVDVGYDDQGDGRFLLQHPAASEVTAEYKVQNPWLCDVLDQLLETEGNLNIESVPEYLQNVAVGAVIPENSTVRQAVDLMIRGLDMVVQHTPAGDLEVIQYTLDRAASHIIGDDDIAANTIEHVDTLEPVSSVTIRYQENHAILSTVAGAVAEDELVDLQSKWRLLTHNNSTEVVENVITVDTSLRSLNAALDIAKHHMFMRGVQRYIYKMDLFAKGAEIRAGDVINLTHTAWGLQGFALVINTEQRLAANRTSIKVLM